MSLISIVLVLVVAGFLTWLVIRFIPMPAPFQQIIMGVVVLFVILWLLGQFGIGGIPALRLR